MLRTAQSLLTGRTIIVRTNLRKAKKRQANYADRGTKAVEFQVGDSVFYKSNQRKGKFDLKWKPYYRIIEKKGPVSYIIKKQLDGVTSKVHAEILRKANEDNGKYQKMPMVSV